MYHKKAGDLQAKLPISRHGHQYRSSPKQGILRHERPGLERAGNYPGKPVSRPGFGPVGEISGQRMYSDRKCNRRATLYPLEISNIKRTNSEKCNLRSSFELTSLKFTIVLQQIDMVFAQLSLFNMGTDTVVHILRFLVSIWFKLVRFRNFSLVSSVSLV